MDFLLAPVLAAWLLLPFAVVGAPPIVALSVRRVTAPAAVLYLAAFGLVVRFYVAADANMDWADHTGGGGSIWAGGTWLVAGTAAATAAVVHAVRRGRPARSAA